MLCVDSEVCSTGTGHIAEGADEDGSSPSVFQPTSEWQEIEKGQAIPAGLHVRMNLQTGAREAKLMEESVSGEVSAAVRSQPEQNGLEFTGDHRRAHHHGYSDRRGIVNKRTKIFTRQEYLDMLQEKEQLNSDPSNLPALTGAGTSSSPPSLEHGPKVKEAHAVRVPVTVHSDVSAMLSLCQTLGNTSSSAPDLVEVLDKLEYHVHQIDNGLDLNAVGGLVLVVRLLNHSSPDVRSAAAAVVGSASQR